MSKRTEKQRQRYRRRRRRAELERYGHRQTIFGLDDAPIILPRDTAALWRSRWAERAATKNE